jgi:hypothetical protein
VLELGRIERAKKDLERKRMHLRRGWLLADHTHTQHTWNRAASMVAARRSSSRAQGPRTQANPSPAERLAVADHTHAQHKLGTECSIHGGRALDIPG